MKTFPNLFKPGMIGKMGLRNRIIYAAIETGYTSDEKGYIKETIHDYFIEMAKGGVGLVTLGVISTLRESPCGKNFPAIWDDTYIPGLKKLTDTIHEHGAKVSFQLAHHGLYLGHETRLAQIPPDQLDLVGPSAMAFAGGPIKCREMTTKDIKHVIEDGFAEAARRARDAGANAVEIHGGTIGLLNQFRSPYFNRRSDEYGGSVENRARFVCAVIEGIRRKVGADIPIILKMNGEEQFAGGLTLEDTLIQAPLFAEAGADALVVTAGVIWISPGGFGGMNYMEPMGPLVPLAAAIKRVVKVPVATIGRIDIALAEAVLRQGKADFIVMGRPLIADPSLPNKAREGRLAEIRRCIYCNSCILAADPAFRDLLKRPALVCAVNPRIGSEAEFVIKRTPSPKKIMVIGGGIAGMEAARVLAERGHQVSLYEKTDKLGGQWNLASHLKGRKQYVSLINSLERGLGQAGVGVVLGQEVTAEFVRASQSDVAVVATGAIPAPLLGGEYKNVVQAEDVLTGTSHLGDNVVVVGGLNPGMEVTYSLVGRCKRLSLILVPKLGRQIDAATFYTLRYKLTELGTYLYPNASVIDILKDGLWIRYSFGLMRHESLFLKADVIVQATVGKPENRLLQELKGIMSQVYAVGDCVEPRNVVAAIREGAEIGYRL